MLQGRLTEINFSIHYSNFQLSMQYIALDFKKTKNELTRVTALVKIQSLQYLT